MITTTYKLSEKCTLEFQQGEFDIKQIFETLAEADEVLGIDHCPKDGGGTNLTFVVREVDGNKYYEMKCKDSRAKLAFGQTRDGKSLFPKRKDENGDRKPDDGWTVWNPKTKREE